MTEPSAPAVSRPLLIVLAVLAALAVLYFLVIGPLLFGGDEEQDLARPPGPAPTAPSTPSPVPSPSPGPAPVPETFEIFSARDPFQQLVAAEAPGAAAGASPAPGTTPAPGVPGATPAPGATPGAAAPPGATVGATRIELVDVFTEAGAEKVLVNVNGTGYEVGEGQVFADRLKVLDISGQCGTFLFGDSRFTLCKGEQISK